MCETKQRHALKSLLCAAMCLDKLTFAHFCCREQCPHSPPPSCGLTRKHDTECWLFPPCASTQFRFGGQVSSLPKSRGNDDQVKALPNVTGMRYCHLTSRLMDGSERARGSSSGKRSPPCTELPQVLCPCGWLSALT